ncbi:MAG: hypothetical protein MI725_10365, partial [Pirellulales bacterium]|nr:hypothetical protein [Pirellulales bacterium]
GNVGILFADDDVTSPVQLHPNSSRNSSVSMPFRSTTDEDMRLAADRVKIGLSTALNMYKA